MAKDKAQTTEIVKPEEPKGGALVRKTAFEQDGFVLPDNAKLPEIKISRETAQFELPNGEFVKALTGHVLHWHYSNVYFPNSFGEGSKFPLCLSPDGRTPAEMDWDEYERQCASCFSCEMNKWGSGENGKGKACANNIVLYVLLDGDVLPSIIKCPPTSLGQKNPLEKWLTNVVNDVVRVLNKPIMQAAQVQLTLDGDKTADDFKIARLHPKTISVVPCGPELDRLEQVYVASRKFWSPKAVAAVMADSGKDGEQKGPF